MNAVRKYNYNSSLGMIKGYYLMINKKDLFNKKNITDLVINLYGGEIIIEVEEVVNTKELKQFIPGLFLFKSKISQGLFIRLNNSNISEISKIINKSRGYVRRHFADLEFTLSDIELINEKIQL